MNIKLMGQTRFEILDLRESTVRENLLEIIDREIWIRKTHFNQIWGIYNLAQQ